MENEEIVPAQKPLFEIEEAPFVPITNKEIDYICNKIKRFYQNIK